MTSYPPNSILRVSLAVSRLRANGKHELAAKLAGTIHVCETHGVIGDPVIALMGRNTVTACPFCSGSAVRERWEAEGRME